MFATHLNARRKEVLQAIVKAYIEDASAVSSQAISHRLRGRISAATIRNVMAELDELGLIWQPHTSAGRIPTDRGYRYYIDSLLEPAELTLEERELIESRHLAHRRAFDELLTELLRCLSNLSGYTSLAFSSLGKDRLYVERTSFILEQPEFQNVQKLQPVLRIFEKQEPLLSIMKEDLAPDGIKVHIGSENPYEDIRECSLVVSNFKIRNRNIGSLGIIGPRRMPYARTISAVSYMAQMLSESKVD